MWDLDNASVVRSERSEMELALLAVAWCGVSASSQVQECEAMREIKVRRIIEVRRGIEARSEIELD